MLFPCDAITGQGNVLHLKKFNPLDDWYGMSPLEAAAYSVDQHNSAGAWNQAMLQNGARPGGAFLYKGELQEGEKERLRQAIDDRAVGAKNAGKPLILFGDATYQEMGMSPKDMDFVNAKHTSARDIALAFGVPPQLLGIPGDNTYSNMQEARLALWEDTVLPELDRLKDSLNNWLVPMFGEGLRLDYDADGIPALVTRRQEKQKSVVELYDKGMISQEEGRVELGWGEKNPNHTFKTTNYPSFSFGGDGEKAAPWRLERKDWIPSGVVEVGTEVDDPSVRAKTSVIVEDLLAKLVDNLGADVVEEIGKRTSLEKSHRVQGYIKNRSATLITRINKTTRKQIRAQLADGFENGENVEQLQARVSAVFKQATEQRAYTIALTESTGAAGFAANEAIRQAGIAQKSWLSTQDEATRETHREMDGQVVEVDGQFLSPAGGQAEYPGGFGIAEEDIGCRCATAAAFGKSGKSLSPDERKLLWHKRETKRAQAELAIVPVIQQVFEIQRQAVLARIPQMVSRIEMTGPQIGQ